jgi:uncharacterized protein YodC (DUF2158 family)
MKVGDVVTLKSGGRLMTVIALDGEAAVVRWYDDHERCFQEQIWLKEALRVELETSRDYGDWPPKAIDKEDDL